MHMEDMGTSAPDQWTIVTGHLARRTATFEGDTTNTADIPFAVGVVRVCFARAEVPAPVCNGVPVLDGYFHF